LNFWDIKSKFEIVYEYGGQNWLVICWTYMVFSFREEVGPDAARKFLGHTQWLVNYWLLQQGFSIGIGDTIADSKTMEKINDTIAQAKVEVKELIKTAQDKQLEAQPGRTMMESFENSVNRVSTL
jgi:DNA-directed RNA polymerase II subunit RPB1